MKLRKIKILFLSGLVLLMTEPSQGQSDWKPKGNPDKWQFEAAVPLWLPWIKGAVGMEGLATDVTGELNATPGELLRNLKMAGMLNVNVTKGNFIAFTEYLYLSLESSNKQFTGVLGNIYTYNGQFKNTIWETAAGARLYFNKGMLDPFFAVRYVSMQATLNATKDGLPLNGASATYSFWVPSVGSRIFYYPKPRWMLFALGDIGASSQVKLMWNAQARVGYVASPTVDVSLGFRGFQFEYSQLTASGSRIVYMNPVMYGLEASVFFYFPKRSLDQGVFPKLGVRN